MVGPNLASFLFQNRYRIFRVVGPPLVQVGIKTNLYIFSPALSPCDPEFLDPITHECSGMGQSYKISITLSQCIACPRSFHEVTKTEVCYMHVCDKCGKRLTLQALNSALFCQNQACPVRQNDTFDTVCIVSVSFGDFDNACFCSNLWRSSFK